MVNMAQETNAINYLSTSAREKEPGLVSTIIPVFNRPRQLSEAVRSVIRQDYRPIEVIIVDDGSTDGETSRVAAEFAREYPGEVFVEHQVNAGPGIARERGRQRARGEFIQYLDSDDLLLSGKFSGQVAALRSDPDACVAYGITFLLFSDGQLSGVPNKDSGVHHVRMFPRFLNQRWWNTSTPLYRASVCDAAGPWTSLRLEEDWEYDCRIAALGGRLAYVPVPVSHHRSHDGPRLSIGEEFDPKRLAMRAQAHTLIWGHALRARLSETSPAEVATFARSLFLLARQCGAAGLSVESGRLLDLAAQAARTVGAGMGDIEWYRRLSSLLGYRKVGQASRLIDWARSRIGLRGRHQRGPN